MGLVLGQSLMVISTTGILLYAKVFPFINVFIEVYCCCLHVSYIVYKHFHRPLHIGSSDPTCVQSFRPVTFYDLCTLCSTYYCTCVSDLSKYCVHLLGKEGLGPVRGGFPISYYVAYRAVMAVGVGILCNNGDFSIWY